MMAWDPAQYLSFGDHRLRPALDLLMRIPAESPRTVVDLGCGTGNVTRHLRRRWPAAKLIALDSSSEMLARARAEAPEIEFAQADAATWTPQAPVDVLYSNALLHWLPDHGTLFARLAGCVAAGGVLAVQMPRNFGAPSHQSLYETVRSGPWRVRLEPMIREEPVKPPAFYYSALSPRVESLDIWETEYAQILEGENPVAEFVKGTWLKPFLDALAEPERSAFEADYRARVLAQYPPQANGRTIFPFRRLFIVARR